MIDKQFFEDLPKLLQGYRERWPVGLCVKVITTDDEEILVSETLSIGESVISLFYHNDAESQSNSPTGERGLGTTALPAVALAYAQIKTVRLIPTPGGRRAFMGFGQGQG